MKDRITELKEKINDKKYLKGAISALAWEITDYVFDRPELILSLKDSNLK